MGFEGAPLWGHDPREGCAEMGRGRHASLATGAFAGAPMTGAPTWPEAAMRTLPVALSVELPMGPRSS
eukprot:5940809-Pyramimonas_sp.AAC.1